LPRHVIHVGFPKCGSTALQGWFAAHPDIAFAYDRLMGCDSAVAFARQTALAELEPEVVVTSCEDFAIPLSDFRPPVDITVQRERVCTRLNALLPDALVLIVTRAYGSMLTSTYAHYVRKGGTLSRPELFRLGEAGAPERGVEDYYDYDAVVSLYERAFGPERVLVMPYELLRDDAGEFVRQLEERLGVASSGGLPPRVNVAISLAELTWYPRFSRLVYRAAAPLGRYRYRVVERYVAVLDRLALRKVAEALARATPPLLNRPPPKISAEVLDRCHPRARRLVARPAYIPYRAEYGAASSIS
jgi:hypothetical protein